jgi:hypothetical protein
LAFFAGILGLPFLTLRARCHADLPPKARPNHTVALLDS